MTPEEFASLPPSIALRILVEGSKTLTALVEAAEKPRSQLPPKYDHRLRRKNQRYVWASEATLESLTWELGRARAEAAEGGQWADKAAKNALALERWVNWRTWEPTSRWQGTRGDVQVNALAPSKHPVMHDWEQRGARPEPPRGDAYEDPDLEGDEARF